MASTTDRTQRVRTKLVNAHGGAQEAGDWALRLVSEIFCEVADVVVPGWEERDATPDLVPSEPAARRQVEAETYPPIGIIREALEPKGIDVFDLRPGRPTLVRLCPRRFDVEVVVPKTYWATAGRNVERSLWIPRGKEVFAQITYARKRQGTRAPFFIGGLGSNTAEPLADLALMVLISERRVFALPMGFAQWAYRRCRRTDSPGLPMMSAPKDNGALRLIFPKRVTELDVSSAIVVDEEGTV